MVSGYFDPIHVGHLEYLENAKKCGGEKAWLVVIVNNDQQAALKKGKAFMPGVHTATARLQLLSTSLLQYTSKPSTSAVTGPRSHTLPHTSLTTPHFDSSSTASPLTFALSRRPSVRASTAAERVKIVQALRVADEVHLACDTDRTCVESIKALKPVPHMFCNGGDQNNNSIPEAPICNELGIKLVDGLGDKIQSSSWLIKVRYRRLSSPCGRGMSGSRG